MTNSYGITLRTIVTDSNLMYTIYKLDHTSTNHTITRLSITLVPRSTCTHVTPPGVCTLCVRGTSRRPTGTLVDV